MLNALIGTPNARFPRPRRQGSFGTAQGFVTYDWRIVGTSYHPSSSGVLSVSRKTALHDYSDDLQPVKWPISAEDETRLTMEVSSLLASFLNIRSGQLSGLPSAWKGRCGTVKVTCDVRINDWPINGWSVKWRVPREVEIEESRWPWAGPIAMTYVVDVRHVDTY